MRFAFAFACALVLAGCAAPAERPAPALGPPTDTTPPIDGTPVPILHADFDSSKVRLRVPSTACTRAEDFLPRTRRSASDAVQLMLTRVRPDACPARSAGTKLLEFWLGEIGIRPGDKVRILNPFEPGAASWPEPASGLRFLVEPRSARPGAAVTLLLQNNYPRSVGYNLCDSGLEQRRGGDWEKVPRPGHGCPRILYQVQARGEAQHPVTLPADLAEGEYRFATGVEIERNVPGLERIYTESFYVRR